MRPELIILIGGWVMIIILAILFHVATSEDNNEK